MEKLDHRFGDDGAFWMSYEDLLKKYQIFDRTRLFTDDWKVTQQWTSVNVPWSLDYNDTKFSFTLEKKAPVVIVLSQVRNKTAHTSLMTYTRVSSWIAVISAVSKTNIRSGWHSACIKPEMMTISSAALTMS